MHKIFWTSFLLSLLVALAVLVERALIRGALHPLAILLVLILLGFAGLSLAAARTTGASGGRLPARLWLSTVAFVLSFAILDLAAAWLFDPRLSPPFVRDEVLHHRLVPGTLTRIHAREYQYFQRVNNLGLRGFDVAVVKDPDTYRILMLGDSFTLGMGVEDDQTFSVLLQERLNAGAGRSVEVINAGIDSYSPILSFLQLSQQLGGLESDLVVLNLDMSDLIQDEVYKTRARRDELGRIVAVDGRRDLRGAPLTSTLRHWVFRKTFVTRRALLYWERLQKEGRPLSPDDVISLRNPELLGHTVAQDSVDRTEQWRSLFGSVLRIRDFCAKRGVDFLLTTYPWGHQVGEHEWTVGRKLFLPEGSTIDERSSRFIETMAAQHDILLLDMTEAFRAQQSDEPLYYDFDMHWRPAGHRLMASELERYLLQSIPALRPAPAVDPSDRSPR